MPVRQGRSRETRERLLAAAERVFAECGYDGAKLSDIAEAAGVSVGAVYFRFKDKETLFQAIAETFTEQARNRLSRLSDELARYEPAQIVRIFVLRTAENVRLHRGLFRAIIERGLEHGPVMSVMMGFRDEIASTLETALRRRMGDIAELGNAVRVATQMIYGFLLIGVINPEAPTRRSHNAVGSLADAVAAYFEALGRK
ncbi:MAG TPA: TetR/AcrR family transcriptional regulator [Rhizomicrobium sp.]|nr:TetR/AcrR family transcriptional regulator [Rhizomicrobium sp.]